MALCVALAIFQGSCASDEVTQGFGDNGKADDSSSEPHFPDCDGGPSNLFTFIYFGAEPYLQQGTVSPRFFSSERNIAAPTIAFDAQGIFDRFAEVIVKAEHNVSLQTFSWTIHSDGPQRVLAAIKELEANRRAAGATEPVVVRILLDTMLTGLNGAEPTSPTMSKTHQALAALDLDPGLVTFELATHTHIGTGSLHSKSLIVDGRYAVLTGANMNDWDNVHCGEHDASFLLEGDIATSLLAEFDDAWRKSELWTCGGDPSGDNCLVDTEPALYDVPKNHVPESACSPMLVVGRNWNGGLQTNDLKNPQDAAFLVAMANSRKVIRIRTPNLNAYPVVDTLVDALFEHPGLEIQIVTGLGYEYLAQGFDGGTNKEVVAKIYERLEERGLENACKRMQIRWYSEKLDGMTPVDGNLDCEAGQHPSHIKYASFDNTVAIVGSANMDNQSFNRSREVNVVVDDDEAVAAWDQQLFGAEFDGAVVVEQCE